MRLYIQGGKEGKREGGSLLYDAIILVFLEGILQGDVREPAAGVRIGGISAASRLAGRRRAVAGVLHGGVLSVADEVDGVEVVVAVLLVVCSGRVRGLVGREVLADHFFHEVDGVGLGHAHHSSGRLTAVIHSEEAGGVGHAADRSHCVDFATRCLADALLLGA